MKLINKLVFPIFLALVIGLGVVAHLLSLDRYNNFVYGKFDLGNMNQMLFNSARGNFMILTDYFGQNVSRFSMSHVDPSLLIFIPINWFYSDANFLLLAQTLAFTISAVLVYMISRKSGLDRITSAGIGLLVMVMPISGYIMVWTTFHSLILAMPFLLLGYFSGLKLSQNKQHFLGKIAFNKNLSFYSLGLVIFYLSFTLTVLSKEEIGFVVSMFCIFLYLKLKNIRKHIIIIAILSFTWSILCFLVIIPSFSNQRIQAVDSFINGLGGVDSDSFTQLRGENYFLYRYSQFGDSYSEIAKNLILKPQKTALFVFSQENLKTFNQLLLPVGYLPLFLPILLLAALPEVAIQVLAGEEGVFSITNHRLLILIPLFLISVIEVLSFIKKYHKYLPAIVASLLVVFNIYLAFVYKNPLIYPFAEKLVKKVYAENIETTYFEFENNINATCAQFLVDQIADKDKVSVPQPLGAKTSNKYFNALFPAGLLEANAVITDVYARKLVDFIDISTKYNVDAVTKLIDEQSITLNYSCNRFMLLTKSPQAVNLGTIQEFSAASTENKKLILEKSALLDFEFEPLGGGLYKFIYTYEIGDEDNRDSLFAYTILVSNGTQKTSFVHFPSYYLTRLNDFPANSVVKEEVIYTMPDNILPKGDYKVYFGIGNREDNDENVYAGEATFDH